MMCDKNLLLVTSIEKHPCLYNSNTQEYMKKDITEKAWAEVSNQLSLPVSECKEKWRNLRYSLLRSLKRSAFGALKKKYYLHKEMEFLLPFIKSRGPNSTFGQLEEEIDEESSHDQEIASPQQQLLEYEFLNPEPAQKRRRDEEPAQNFLEAVNSDTYSRRQFMLGLMPEIDALSERQMKVFRRKILELLDDITDESGFVNSPTRVIKPEPADSGLQTVTYHVHD